MRARKRGEREWREREEGGVGVGGRGGERNIP